MNVKASNPEMKTLIATLRKKTRETEKNVWAEIATRLNKPTKKRASLNLWKLQKSVQDGDTIIVPGTVLGNGDFKAKATIAAFKFTETAREKITASGGKAVSIQELMKENPKGSKVKIIA